MTIVQQSRTMADAVPRVILPPPDSPRRTECVDHLKLVRDFVIENFLFGEEGKLKQDTSFLEEGIIDSTGILELVNFLEETFKIAVDDDDIIPENFDSLKNIVAYLERKNILTAKSAENAPTLPSPLEGEG